MLAKLDISHLQKRHHKHSRDESTTNIVQSGIYTVLEKDGTYNVHLTPKKGSSPDFKMGWVV